MNEIESILTDIFNCSRTDLYIQSPSIIFKDRGLNRIDEIFRKRAKENPLQYVLGYTEFMGLRLKVNKDALIPRPETEILVEALIGHRPKAKSQRLKILDIGTGSGCIAITLAKFLRNADIVATDISENALVLARENAKLHNVKNNIKFLQSDIFANDFFTTDIKFDMIVSNPPYIPTKEIGVFDKTTTKEPRIALDGGRDGLDFYRKIIKGSETFLKEDGFLFLELGDNQANKVSKMLSDKWFTAEFKKDYIGIERIGIIKRK